MFFVLLIIYDEGAESLGSLQFRRWSFVIQSSIVLSLTTVPAGPSLTTDCGEGPPRQWFHVSILTLTMRLFPARAFTLGTMSCSSIVHVFEWWLYCSSKLQSSFERQISWDVSSYLWQRFVIPRFLWCKCSCVFIYCSSTRKNPL